MEDDSDNLSDTLSEKLSEFRSQGNNLLETVKENIDQLIKNDDSAKRETSQKRWWTPEEVPYFINAQPSYPSRMNY